MKQLLSSCCCLVFLVLGCNREPASEPEVEEQVEVQKRSKTPIDRDEQRKRTEAVRRAGEDLHIRGINTQGYLINLIAEEQEYKVFFVKHVKRSLRREIMVRVRKEDFEILGIEGAGTKAAPRE